MPPGHTSVPEEETEFEEAAPALILSWTWVYAPIRMISLNIH